MTLEQTLAIAESVHGFISTLAWPAVVVFIAVRFSPQLREFFSTLSELSFKAAGVEATATRKIVAAAELGRAEAKVSPSGETHAVTSDARAIAEIVEQRVNPRSVRRLSKTTILWVDDHPENNSYERRALEALGIRFYLSTSTGDALDKLKIQRFDAIISDMTRGEDDEAGLTLLDEIRKRGDQTPVIIYPSVSAAVKYRSEARRRGATGITSNPSELFDIVVETLVSGVVNAA